MFRRLLVPILLVALRLPRGASMGTTHPRPRSRSAPPPGDSNRPTRPTRSRRRSSRAWSSRRQPCRLSVLRTPDGVLLSRADIQADLRLTAEQRRRLNLFETSYRAGQKELDDAASVTNQNVFSPLPVADIVSLQSIQEDFNGQIENTIDGILTRQQRSRFIQIRLQLDGPMAFVDPALLEKLDVDDDQAAQIRGILAATREEMVNNAQFPLTTRDVPRRDGARPAVPERALEEQLAAARVDNNRLLQSAFGRIAQVLRKHQWDAYLKLRGAPFVPFARASAPPRPPPSTPAATPALRQAR